MRLVAGLLLLVACSLFGNSKAAGLKARLDTLRALRQDIGQIGMQMEYSGRTLEEILLSTKNLRLYSFWQAFAQQLSQNGPLAAWENALAEMRGADIGFAALRKEELCILEGFIATLGVSDLQSQRKGFELVDASLGQTVEDLAADYAKKGKLFRSLGVIAGIALAIMIV